MPGNPPALGLAPPPDDPAALRRFPRKTLRKTGRLWRVSRRRHGPWWFGSSLTGRFDLLPPYGTCYLAGDELGALLEVLGGSGRSGGAVSRPFLADRRVRRLTVPAARSLSDLTSRRAIGFGVTTEIGTFLHYELCQRWATRLHESGSGGVTYWLRHDPSKSRGYALFDTGGEKARWKRGKEREISEGLIRRLESECGIQVLDVPRSSQLRFGDDP